jgi:hypothetical protein
MFRRTQLLHFTANLKVGLIGMEACGWVNFRTSDCVLSSAMRSQRTSRCSALWKRLQPATWPTMTACCWTNSRMRFLISISSEASNVLCKTKNGIFRPPPACCIMHRVEMKAGRNSCRLLTIPSWPTNPTVGVCRGVVTRYAIVSCPSLGVSAHHTGHTSPREGPDSRDRSEGVSMQR